MIHPKNKIMPYTSTQGTSSVTIPNQALPLKAVLQQVQNGNSVNLKPANWQDEPTFDSFTPRDIQDKRHLTKMDVDSILAKHYPIENPIQNPPTGPNAPLESHEIDS